MNKPPMNQNTNAHFIKTNKLYVKLPVCLISQKSLKLFPRFRLYMYKDCSFKVIRLRNKMLKYLVYTNILYIELFFD